MFNTCGKIVRNIWVSTRETCTRLSTALGTSHQLTLWSYGNLQVMPNVTQKIPLGYSHLLLSFFYLLITKLSTVSTAPIITKKKELKEI